MKNYTYKVTNETGPRGRQFHMVLHQKNSKLTNLMKMIQIEGYTGKQGSNPQGNT